MLPSTDVFGRSKVHLAELLDWFYSRHQERDDKMDFIGIKYGLNEDANVFDIFTGNAKLIEEIFIGVFDQIELIRRGSATQSNSRTSLLIGIDEYESVKEQIAWGWVRNLLVMASTCNW